MTKRQERGCFSFKAFSSLILARCPPQYHRLSFYDAYVNKKTMLHASCCTESHIQRSTPLSMPFLIFLGASFPFTYERDHAEAHVSIRWILACSMISVDNYWYFFSKINRPIQKAVEPPSQLNHGTIQVERSWKTTVKNFIIFVSSSHCSSAWAWSDCGS